MEPSIPAHDSKERKRREPILIENIYEKETTESFVERHFREDQVHRCRSVAEFDVDAIAEQYGSDLIRSAQELEVNPEADGYLPRWTMTVFKRSSKIFWHFVIKSGGYGAKDPQKEYTLTVTANTAEKAASETLMLQEHFTASDTSPGFFLIRNVNNPRRVPLKPEYGLSPEMLELHYGAGFAEWTERFAKGLSQNGLSILRGKPGTGKTSFLRHLIYTCMQTHRFYYLPVESFGLLQAEMPDFLERERKRFKDMVLVVVLEDAEQLLLQRNQFRDGLASTLLNFTDGFIGDMVHAHLVCTVNSEFKDLDSAVLRPGRQRFFHEFEFLEWTRARNLAEKLGISLTEERSYSLAELYHFKDVQNADRLADGESKRIGFASN